jgi:hypothetical protein
MSKEITRHEIMRHCECRLCQGRVRTHDKMVKEVYWTVEGSNLKWHRLKDARYAAEFDMMEEGKL